MSTQPSTNPELPANAPLTQTAQQDGASTTSPDKEFISLFVKNQRPLYLFLLAQTADPQLAEELQQSTNVVVWSKWQTFEAGTNFRAWIYRIASLELMKHRQRTHRSKLLFDDEFVRTVAESVEKLHDLHEERRQALATCLEKLRPRDREMIQLRYQLGEDGKLMSDQLQRPVNSIYQSLGRIRRMLLDCIERELAAVTR